MTHKLQKNKEDKYIVLYDIEELLSIQAANVMFKQKFIDNVIVLTGGAFSCCMQSSVPRPLFATDFHGGSVGGIF